MSDFPKCHSLVLYKQLMYYQKQYILPFVRMAAICLSPPAVESLLTGLLHCLSARLDHLIAATLFLVSSDT